MDDKKKKWIRILAMALCAVSIAAGMVFFFRGEQADSGQTESGQEDGKTDGSTGSAGDRPGFVTSLPEKEPYQQYLYVDWDGGTYFSSRTSVGGEKIGQHLCDLVAYGFENEACTNGVRYQKNAGIYRIDQISGRFAVAVCLEGDETYYVYTREDYFPETLGDFIEDLNLAQYLEIDTCFECGDELEKAYTGEIAAVFWDTFLSQKEREIRKIPRHNNKVWNPDLGLKVFETHVSYTLTGWEDRLFYMTENGGIGTELLGSECVFVLGEDVAEGFLEYININFGQTLPTATSVPTPTKIPSCTPSPEPTPISPTPTLPPLDITLVDDKLPWDDQALPETDHVYVVRFIPTERDDLLVAYTACVDVKWDINDFYDDKKRPKILYTWWLRDDAFCFVSSRGGCPVGYNGTAPDYIAQDLSRWEDVEPGMYNISHDLFRWIIKWYEPIWWCGVKDGEIVYVRQHIEG